MFGYFITFCDLVRLIDTAPQNHCDDHYCLLLMVCVVQMTLYCNLCHCILPESPVENVELLENKIKAYIGKKKLINIGQCIFNLLY